MISNVNQNYANTNYVQNSATTTSTPKITTPEKKLGDNLFITIGGLTALLATFCLLIKKNKTCDAAEIFADKFTKNTDMPDNKIVNDVIDEIKPVVNDKIVSDVIDEIEPKKVDNKIVSDVIDGIEPVVNDGTKILHTADETVPTETSKPLTNILDEIEENVAKTPAYKIIAPTSDNELFKLGVEATNSNIRRYQSNLKRGLIEKNPEIEKLMQEHDEGFNAILEKEVHLYRGMDAVRKFDLDNMPTRRETADIINNAKIDDIITPDSAYPFATDNKNIAKKWNTPDDDAVIPPMLFDMKMPKDTRLYVIDHKNKLVQVLLPRNAQYKLISRTKDENGVINVVMEYILPKKTS